MTLPGIVTIFILIVAAILECEGVLLPTRSSSKKRTTIIRKNE